MTATREPDIETSVMGRALAAVAGCFLAALIGCAPVLLPILPSVVLALPLVYGAALLSVAPASVLVAAPLYIVATRIGAPRWVTPLVFVIPAGAVLLADAVVQAVIPDQLRVPLAGTWFALSVAVFGGALTLLFDRPGSRSMLTVALLTSIGVVGWIIAFWMAASARLS